MFKKILSPLHPHDVAVISFAVFLSLLNFIFQASIPPWDLLILINVLVSLGIIALAYFDERGSGPFLRFVHLWYLAPLIFLAFKELYLMIFPIHGRDYDGLLIAADRWLFGVDPTVWLAQIAHPALTEVLQIAYASFYFLFLLAGYELYRRGDTSTYLLLAFYVVYGFFLSYIGYLFLPAVGPRFTIHNFDALNNELPGLVLTNVLRDFVNLGESIPLDVPHPIAFAQRDAFPSGHAMMMIVLMYFTARYQMKTSIFILITGTLLIIGTVYLRYHYVIDLIAGILFAILCIWTAPVLYEWWQRLRLKLRS